MLSMEDIINDDINNHEALPSQSIIGTQSTSIPIPIAISNIKLKPMIVASSTSQGSIDQDDHIYYKKIKHSIPSYTKHLSLQMADTTYFPSEAPVPLLVYDRSGSRSSYHYPSASGYGKRLSLRYNPRNSRSHSAMGMGLAMDNSSSPTRSARPSPSPSPSPTPLSGNNNQVEHQKPVPILSSPASPTCPASPARTKSLSPRPYRRIFEAGQLSNHQKQQSSFNTHLGKVMIVEAAMMDDVIQEMETDKGENELQSM